MERDGTTIGRGAGSQLAEVLVAFIDGVRPPPLIGVSRVGARELRRVVFEGGRDAERHEGFHEAGTWLQTPGLVDGFLVNVHDDLVRILVPSATATAFDIVWTVRFAFVDGELLTSEPGFVVADGMDELLDDFNDGVAAGLELHPRTAEIRSGFGALGEFEPEHERA